MQVYFSLHFFFSLAVSINSKKQGKKICQGSLQVFQWSWMFLAPALNVKLKNFNTAEYFKLLFSGMWPHNETNRTQNSLSNAVMCL